MKINKTIINKLEKNISALLSECGDNANKICDEIGGSLNYCEELQIFLNVLKNEHPDVYNILVPEYKNDSICYNYVININSMLDLVKYSVTFDCNNLFDGLHPNQIVHEKISKYI